MALIRVTAAQVKSTADQLRQYDSQFKSQLDNLETHEQNLSSMWEGQALEQIARSYEEAEARNTDTATKRSF